MASLCWLLSTGYLGARRAGGGQALLMAAGAGVQVARAGLVGRYYYWRCSSGAGAGARCSIGAGTVGTLDAWVVLKPVPLAGWPALWLSLAGSVRAPSVDGSMAGLRLVGARARRWVTRPGLPE